MTLKALQAGLMPSLAQWLSSVELYLDGGGQPELRLCSDTWTGFTGHETVKSTGSRL